MTLGEKIQKLRKQRGLSQEALAKKVTVTRQTISKWELGQSLPDLDFIAAWLMILPSLISRTKIVLKTLVAVSAIPIPLLAILSLLLNKSVIFTLGICITLIAIAAIWIIYGIFRKCAKNLWRAFGFALLVLIPAPIAITHISACFFPQVQFNFTSDIFNSGITLALSLVCFGVDYLLYHRKGGVTGKK